jgi:hypothetical protein
MEAARRGRRGRFEAGDGAARDWAGLPPGVLKASARRGSAHVPCCVEAPEA